MNINNTEIERKFLVANDSYKSLATSCVRICQAYMAFTNKSTVRVRIFGDKGFITIKGKPKNEHSFSRFEWEKEISLTEAEQLLQLCEDGVIDKYRWLVPMGDGHICEVDEFLAENEGLVLAEIELESEEQSYIKPDFLAQEVTMDKRYYNSFLSHHPYKTWKEHDNV